MKKITLLCMALLGLNTATAQSWDWMFSTQSVESTVIFPSYSTLTGTTTDPTGNVYMNCFSSHANMSFGSQTFESNSWAGRNYLVKLNSSGNVQWVKPTGVSDAINTIAITTDTDGNIYSAGEFTGSYNFEGYTFSTGDNSGLNSFITKKDSEGNTLWAKHIGVEQNSEDPEYINRFIRTYDIVTDALGNVFVCGQVRGTTAVFDNINLTVTGESDTFIAKYDNTGTVLWVKLITEGGYQGNRKLACDSAGNVYMAGSHGGDGSIILNDTEMGNGNNFTFVIKYTSDGDIVWLKSHGAVTYDLLYCYNIAIDTNDNIYIVGFTDFDAITFGSTTLVPSADGQQYGFVVKYNNAGDVIWAKSPTGGSAIKDVQAGNNGIIYIIGNFWTPQISFDNITLTNQGNANGFIARMNTNGNYNWIEQIGGTSHSETYLAVDNTNNSLYASGNYTNIKFGEETYDASLSELYVSKFNMPFLGVDDLKNQKQFLYPNPATNVIKISALGTNNTIPYKITDLTGRVVKEGPAETEINVATLPGGIYIFTMGTYRSKFIKE